MKILVTGGAGFIGRWVVKSLLEKGCSIWVIDNLLSGRRENIAGFMDDSKFEFIEGDILDRELLREIFDIGFDVCIHLAACINVQKSINNPEKNFEVNVRGTFNLLEEAKRKNTKFVLVSTCMVYREASNNKPINENHPLCPCSPYAATKIASETLAFSYHYTYGLPVTVLRPFNTYGPFQRTDSEGGVIPIFITRYLKGESLLVYGDGNQTRDFIYVEDCARAIADAAFSGVVWGETVNIGSGKDISINELTRLIAGKNGSVRHIPHIHPQSEISRLICDWSKAKRLLKWKPRVSLVEGIERTRKWITNSILLESGEFFS